MLEKIKKALKKTAFGEFIYAQEATLKWQLQRAGSSLHPSAPQLGWVNETLQSKMQVQSAVDEVKKCGLTPHPDAPKNWDALSTLKDILELTPRTGTVLEVGAPLYSVMLQWLYLYGYRGLHGIDLVYDKPVQRGPIRYEYGDLTQTHFGNESFDAVVSLSVIEHNVDLKAYFKEMARLLKPKGRLYTSTDYWSTPVETHAQEAYGGPIKIFTREDMEAMIRLAAPYGLTPTEPPSWDCDEKAVCWERFQLNYTFTCFALEKSGD
ncbi:MAG: hypothetical protein CMH56_01855 [Myxococcales bacterium]|nr:hypothetical protein [Myxococcales bacterium]